MLQLSEQRQAGDASQAEAAEAVQFLIFFVRELIRNNPSSDVLYLSMAAAADRANLTKDQAEKFIAWVMDQQDKSPWPKGFFS